MSTPTAGDPGDHRAWIDSDLAITLPVTVDATHKTFKYDGTDYTMTVPANIVTPISSKPGHTGSSGAEPVRTLEQLCALINAATAAGTRFDTVVKATVSPFDPSKIRFTAVATGVNTNTFATGTSNSVLSRIGVSNGLALAHGSAATSTGVSFASDLTTDDTAPSAPGRSGNGEPSAAPTSPAGTNGVLSSVITWTKSTDTTVTQQLVELIKNSDSSVLASAVVSPNQQTVTLATTAVNQKARVTAINPLGVKASALSATILPTAS